MSYELVRQSVSDYVKTNFTGWPIALDNLPYQPTPGQPWVRFGIHPNVEQPEEITGGRPTTERMEGFIWFQIFLPENTGTAEAYKIGDALKLLFFQVYIIAAGKPTVRCSAAPLLHIGIDEAGWDVWNVNVPYLVFAQVP
jgi:hypothetical protein